MNVAEIIALILHAKSEASALKRFSLDDGATIKDIPTGSSIHIAFGGILIHLGGDFTDAGTTYSVEAKRSTIPWIDNTNFAILNGSNCPGGIYLHNETELSGITSKNITISYGVMNPNNNIMMRFYVDIHI